MNSLMEHARAWAQTELNRAVTLAQSPDGMSESKKVLANVRKQFSGQPEADDAKIGIKAVKRLDQIMKLEATDKAPEGVREKAAADYKQPRWKALFTDGDLPVVKKPKKVESDDDDDDEDDEDSDDSEIEIG